MMTETEIRDSIKSAMDEPKAPQELIEKGLMMARVFEKAVAEKRAAGEKEIDTPHKEAPERGGSNLSL